MEIKETYRKKIGTGRMPRDRVARSSSATGKTKPRKIKESVTNQVIVVQLPEKKRKGRGGSRLSAGKGPH